MKVTVKLEKDHALPESAKLAVKAVTEKKSPEEWKKGIKLVEDETEKGHRELAGVRFYQIVFQLDGEEIQPEEPLLFR